MSDSSVRLQYSDDGGPISIEKLREIVALREGRLFWMVSMGRRAKIGKEAGCHTADGYRIFIYKNKRIFTHRAVFALANGRWPRNAIDHINLIRDDNRPENLREATNGENMQNAGMLRNNTSGIKGVSWNKRLSKWHAYVESGGKRKHLGFHFDFELAELIANEGRRIYHGEFARFSHV